MGTSYFDKAETDFTTLRGILKDDDKSMADNCLAELEAARKRAAKKEKSFFKNVMKSSDAYKDVDYFSSIPETILPENKQVSLTFTFSDFTDVSLQVELFSSKLPKTVERFLSLLPVYKGSLISRVVPNFGILCGKSSSASFPEEGFPFKHSVEGVLSLHSVSPMFYILTAATPQRDKKAVAFGVVRDGLPALNKTLAAVETDSQNIPTEESQITFSAYKYLN